MGHLKALCHIVLLYHTYRVTCQHCATCNVCVCVPHLSALFHIWCVCVPHLSALCHIWCVCASSVSIVPHLVCVSHLSTLCQSKVGLTCRHCATSKLCLSPVGTVAHLKCACLTCRHCATSKRCLTCRHCGTSKVYVSHLSAPCHK